MAVYAAAASSPPPPPPPVSLCPRCTSALGLLCYPKYSIQFRFNNPVWGLWIKRLFVFQKTDTLHRKTKQTKKKPNQILVFLNSFFRDNAVDDWRRLNTT
jgi:hypothetical protein